MLFWKLKPAASSNLSINRLEEAAGFRGIDSWIPEAATCTLLIRYIRENFKIATFSRLSGICVFILLLNSRWIVWRGISYQSNNQVIFNRKSWWNFNNFNNQWHRGPYNNRTKSLYRRCSRAIHNWLSMSSIFWEIKIKTMKEIICKFSGF